MARIGVLALQGGFAAHTATLVELGHDVVEVRRPDHVNDLDGLVLPGGESSTQIALLHSAALVEPLTTLVQAQRPVLATCAGIIISAREVRCPEQTSLGWIDIAVERNAYGRQLYSCEAVSDGGLPMVMIRAPRITACGPHVEVLDRYRGDPVLVRQGAFVAATFHPELTASLDVHRDVFGVVC